MLALGQIYLQLCLVNKKNSTNTTFQGIPCDGFDMYLDLPSATQVLFSVATARPRNVTRSDLLPTLPERFEKKKNQVDEIHVAPNKLLSWNLRKNWRSINIVLSTPHDQDDYASIYICICTCICRCRCICVCQCIRIRICICKYIYIYVHVCICISLHFCVLYYI